MRQCQLSECRHIVTCALFVLAALTFIGWVTAFCFLSPWYGGSWFRVVIASVCIFAVLLFVSCVVHCLTAASLQKCRWLVVAGMVFLVSLVVIRILDGVPGWHMPSDYGQAQICLESGKVMFDHPVQFEYWCAYELLISFLGVVFAPVLLTGQLLNAVLMAAAVYPVYKTTERIAGSLAAVFVSLLMGLSPSLLFYSSFLTSEFAGAVMLLYAFWFFDCSLNGGLCGCRSCVCALAAGITLGLSHAMKPLAPLFMAVALCSAVVGVVAVCSPLRRAIVLAGLCALMFVAYKVTFAGIRTVVEDAVGQQIVGSGLMPWGGLCVGLNLASGGVWSLDIQTKVRTEPVSEIRRFVIERAKREYPAYPKLLIRKFAGLYSPNGWQSFWYEQITGRSPSSLFCRCRDNWFACECLFGLLGVLGIMFSASMEWRRLFPATFSMLMIVAFTALIMLLEVQERYRISIYPFYFLIMPYAWACICRNRFARRLFGRWIN